jgi:hypothetical protein
MSESLVHTELVRSLCVWVSDPDRARSVAIVYSDLPENSASNKPPSIGGYFPDVYCASIEGLPIYIGEAKTAGDLESKRSREQLRAYLQFLARYDASSLIVAVPWRAVPTARSLIRSIQRIENIFHVSTVFLEKLPG